MSLELIPAIDLYEGECVRLTEGELGSKKVYSDNPSDMARHFQEQGASRLHLVDLEGAFQGSVKNSTIIEKIANKVSIPVQVGGGIRSIEAIERLVNMGVDQVILGTKAYNDRDFLQSALELFHKNIIVGVDIKGGKVATEGWVNVSDTKTYDYLSELTELGVPRVILTDISKDGKLQGPNLELFKELAIFTELDLVLSGGMSSLEDINRIQKLQNEIAHNLAGVILGKALYEGKIDLQGALETIRK
ncbi:1-(5-phosphoribosyl)-5-[(5-phosphoribosylamino)methylideneamino]imidazole-4-carboxamide isomerase [Natranaerobius thermophilus]|uniref:1-(5-phosphoribosyl)-5-[(5-phosphoribosylamino)methylideneamino] imidazole-4-carboxamide isomerase n=1 Tax=Natranaerobius thermophilus (strain ATCC BAA-1301 / DSM 18059 / JW/NM-WN-LF) TaxID=457570 RepID=B2A6X1_NATTJ|nr:1-(5-phosphoribosyl)-5-[(5-phosphoribosylamino)methylideneamino]imidazole-4-carboxamide isomerase [Natranaerobius thermophilus]ACB85565.1 phosphoribosylformimino-5-aminoimidazole carboxamide ribotide isomerase [Natranaerobius thermophilus JW/NM-WN-LF]